jgi:hypothetical protein
MISWFGIHQPNKKSNLEEHQQFLWGGYVFRPVRGAEKNRTYLGMYSNVVMQVLNLDQPIKMVKLRDLVVT